ncbi:hypothetical protein ACJJTC_006277 [Scirpophaga incertulas]
MSLDCLFVSLIAILLIKGSQSCFTSSDTQTIYVKKGTAYYGECSCVTPGYNVGHLKWVDSHNQEIDVLRPGTDQKAYMERQVDSISLHIPNVTKSKSGLYRCITNFEGTEYSKSFYVLAYEPITINPPEEQYIVLGNRSLVKCKVHAEDESKVMTSWHKVVGDKLALISNNEKYEIAMEGLYISDVIDEDKGMYSCSAIDRETYDEVDKDINVKIITMPVIKELKIREPRNEGTNVIAGDILVMECIADGIPHPEYIWRKADTNIMENPRWKQEVNDLMIDPVLPEDQGRYECIAQSMAGVASKSIDINVYFPPNITSFPSLMVVEGSTVELVCDAVGRPAPNVSIIYKGQDEDDIRDVDENDVMDNLSFIKKVDKSHDGIYVCNASNEVNYTLEEMYLTVLYKPYFEAVEEIVWGWNGQVVNLTCSPDSKPPSFVQWRFLTENSSVAIEVNKIILEETKLYGQNFITVNVSEQTQVMYGIYECNASNHLGYAVRYIHFREGHIPPPIRNATVLSIKATSVLFHIEKPDSFEGPPILGYTAEYDQTKDYNVTDIHTNRTWSTDRPFIIENLKADTSYFIRFAPINSIGNGAWSEYYEFETLRPSVPNQPSWNLSIEESYEEININDTNQAISWTAPGRQRCTGGLLHGEILSDLRRLAM